MCIIVCKVCQADKVIHKIQRKNGARIEQKKHKKEKGIEQKN